MIIDMVIYYFFLIVTERIGESVSACFCVHFDILCVYIWSTECMCETMPVCVGV